MIGHDLIADSNLAVRRACDELSRRLRAGQACRAEEFLGSESAIGSDTDAVLELLYTEFIIREQLGQRPQPAEWFERFPQWQAELSQLFEVHDVVEHGSTNAADAAGTRSEGDTAADRDEPRPADLFVDRIGGYKLLDEIGRGGMGVVYRAQQPGLARVVALKMMLSPPDERERARFRREAEATARLSHQNIVQIYEVGQVGNLPFLSMEFVAGKSLDKQLAAAVLAPRAAAELLMTLTRAVAYAHAQGIVHRDLKPANIIVAADGTPKITDFGLARRVEVADGPQEARTDGPPSVAIVGTPAYMSPEQSRAGSAVGPAADVYSLGAILYEAVTGRPPFRGETALDIWELVRSQEPVPPSRLVPKVPRDLEIICLKCLAKQPQQRYTSATSLADDLRRFLTGEPILARPVGRVERAVRWCHRNPVIAALTGGIALALVCGTVASTSLAVWALREKNSAAAHALLASASSKQEQAARELAELRFRQAEKAVEEYLDGIENDEHLREADFLALRKRLVASAVPFYEEFVRQKPGDKALEIKRGRAYGRLGFIRKQIGERQQAAADFEQMRSIFQRLGTTDHSVRRELAKSHYGLASALDGIGQKPEAEIEYRQSLDLFRELVAEFPRDAGIRRQLARCQRELGLLLNHVGVVLGHLNRREEAKAMDRRAIGFYQQLVESSPTSVHYLTNAATNLINLALLLKKDGEIDEAGQRYAQAAEHHLKAVQAAPTNLDYPRYLRNDYHGVGDMALLQKDHAAAADAADKLVQARPDNVADAEMAARIFGRCVTLAEQDAQLSEDDRASLAQSYADRAMEHLREAVRRGYRDAARIPKLTALAPLRERPDFQQLVQELEAKTAEP